MGGLEALSLKFALCPSSKIKLFNSYHYAICIVTQMLLPPPPRKKIKTGYVPVCPMFWVRNQDC